jgi:2-haloacid dehalogenase
MAVRALTFDIIGTVFDWFGTFSARVPPLAKKYGLSLDASAFASGAEDGYAAGVAAVSGGKPWTPPDRHWSFAVVRGINAEKIGEPYADCS